MEGDIVVIKLDVINQFLSFNILLKKISTIYVRSLFFGLFYTIWYHVYLIYFGWL